MTMMRSLFGILAVLFFVALPRQAAALDDCDFGFKVNTESSALQALTSDANAKGGFWLSINDAPPDIQKIAKYVGLLQTCVMTPDGKPRTVSISGTTRTINSPQVFKCTASLLSDNRLITNHHCFYDPIFAEAGFNIVTEARVTFGYRFADDTSGTKTYRVLNREISKNQELDALLLQIIGGDANADLGGHFPMDTKGDLQPLQELKMIHHPAGQPQQYSSGTCKVHRLQSQLGEQATSLRHTCETTGGSSGSLILDARSLAIVGLHNLGGLNRQSDSFNAGHRIGPINAALGLGMKEMKPFNDSENLALNIPKADPCDPQFILAQNVNQCAVWDVYLASCSGHSRAIEARRLKASVCKADSCDSQFETAKASDSCLKWKAYTESCSDHEGMLTATVAFEKACTTSSAATNDPNITKTISELLSSADKYYEQEKFTEAFALYRTAADKGDATAQYIVGSMYRYGIGVSQSDIAALEWFRAAADQGEPNALNELGYMYSEGLGVPQSDVQAVRLYKEAGERGSSIGFYNLGFMYAYGYGVVHDNSEAAKWFERSARMDSSTVDELLANSYQWYVEQAEAGDVAAQNSLGLAFLTGRGIEQNNQEASKWFSAAADKDYARAQKNLGDMYYFGWGFSKDIDVAATWYRKAANQDFALAQNQLGVMSRNGEGMPRDELKAFEWFLKAAHKGHAEAQYNLGEMYYDGTGVPKSDTEAVKWYRKAAEQGYAVAQNDLGYMYANGLGVPQSDTEAVKWYREAADSGNGTGQCNLSIRLAWGKGTAKDPTAAADWTIKSLQSGEEWCITNMTEKATVREIQKKLKQRGLYTGAIDGSNGPNTQAAMRKLLP